MAIKQKPIYVCDHFGKEIEGEPIRADGVEHEGPGEIHNGTRVFYLSGEHYCNLACLFGEITKELS